ncbi:MAG TPA: hypothetical protein VGB94_06715 [Acidobacteriaceae bacterium]
MTKPKLAFSPLIVEEFCKLCDWTHEVWLHHRELFDNNPRAEELNKASFTGAEFRRLAIISQEYSILQIAKLHDPAVSFGNITLTIDYMVTYGGWSKTVLDRLRGLQEKLDTFAKPLREARHKILSHNDLAAIVAGNTLGAFPNGEDVKYFETLKEFVNVVHDEVLEGTCLLFDTLVKNDVVAFLAAIKTSTSN